MFDLKFYKLVKAQSDFHNDINDYRCYKNCKTRREMMEAAEDFYNNIDADINIRNHIDKYNRLCYLYFNDYNESKIQKQVQQLRNNIHNFNEKRLGYSP